MKKYILVALFALVGNPSCALAVCTEIKPCLDKMKDIPITISRPQEYKDGITAAFSCLGWTPIKNKDLLLEYNQLTGPKSTWTDILMQRTPGDPIRTCLAATKPCTPNKPCLSKMAGIPMNITTQQDYADGMKAAFRCVGWGDPKTDQYLLSEYNNLKGAKSTWADIIKNIDATDKQNSINKLKLTPCLKEING